MPPPIPQEREYWLGRSTAWVILGNMLAPSFLDRYLAHNAVEAQSADDPGHQHTRDNLYKPERGLHRTRGSFGWESDRGAALLPGNATRAAAVIGGLCAERRRSALRWAGCWKGRNGSTCSRGVPPRRPIGAAGPGEDVR
jgi:hypothetical protein